MYCNNCGAQNTDSASFCIKCGNPLQQPVEPVESAENPNGAEAPTNAEGAATLTAPKKKKTGMLVAIILVVVVLVGAGAAAYFIFDLFGGEAGEAYDWSEYYDYVLCEGDGCSLVVKKVKTSTGSELQYGVIDSNANWVVPLSADAPFVYGKLGEITIVYGGTFPDTDTSSSSKDDGEYSVWCNALKQYIRYDDERYGSAFIYSPPSADAYYELNSAYTGSRSFSYYHGDILELESGQWYDLDEYRLAHR